MHGLITGTPNVAVIAANASPPTSDKPSLLSHRDVETLWHEFGHLLHHCLSRVPVRSLAGTRVAHDFVELPSQMMENFCWEPQMLKRFARHYLTDQPIPDALIERLRAARTFRAATGQMRQLGFALLDLCLHGEHDRLEGESILEFARRVQQPFAPAELPPQAAMVTTFSHLFSRPVGYAAGYYSYKWAEVLDADAFGRFAEAGIVNPEVGMDFRRKVLEVGDSMDPAVVFENFRGRPPSPDALLRRLGLSS
jgi:oligopeptidase A